MSIRYYVVAPEGLWRLAATCIKQPISFPQFAGRTLRILEAHFEQKTADMFRCFGVDRAFNRVGVIQHPPLDQGETLHEVLPAHIFAVLHDVQGKSRPAWAKAIKVIRPI